MNAHEVAVAAIESRRTTVSSRRKGVTYLAALVVLLVHLHPFANGTYTNEQLAIRILLACSSQVPSHGSRNGFTLTPTAETSNGVSMPQLRK